MFVLIISAANKNSHEGEIKNPKYHLKIKYATDIAENGFLETALIALIIDSNPNKDLTWSYLGSLRVTID